MSITRRFGRVGSSIQFRITAVAAIAVLAMLCLASIAVLGRFERQLIEQVDRELVSDAAVVQRSIEAGNIGALRRSGAVVDLVIQVVTPQGAVVDGTSNGGNVAPLATPASLKPGDTRRLETIDIDSVGSIRIVVEPLTSRPAVLVIGRSIGQAEAAVDSLRRLGLTLVPLITILMAGLVWWVVGRALRPVETLRRSVEAITEDDLSHRVATPDTDDELARLGRTMNAMLDRVERSIEREMRFVADASHELRSPLAGARVLLETESDDPIAVLESRAQTLASIAKLEHLVGQMLALARVDGDNADRGHTRLIDLDDLVLTQAARMQRDVDVSLDISNVSGGQVRGDDNELGRMVENLATNAARHARRTVRLGVGEHGEYVRLTVEDDGNGIPAGERSRVFQRFTRLDESRVRDDGGTGLGLAIVQAIVDDHGGSIYIDDSELGGARFTVELPASNTAKNKPPAHDHASG